MTNQKSIPKTAQRLCSALVRVSIRTTIITLSMVMAVKSGTYTSAQTTQKSLTNSPNAPIDRRSVRPVPEAGSKDGECKDLLASRTTVSILEAMPNRALYTHTLSYLKCLSDRPRTTGFAQSLIILEEIGEALQLNTWLSMREAEFIRDHDLIQQFLDETPKVR